MNLPAPARRFLAGGAALALAACATALLIRAQTGASPTTPPGVLSDGTTLLANGWRLGPAGRHVTVGDLPLNLLQTPDSKYLIVTNNGVATPTLSMVDIEHLTVVRTVKLQHAWLGLAWSSDGKRLYVGGAARNNVQEFTYEDGQLNNARTFALPGVSGSFSGGLAVSPDGRTLLATAVFGQSLSAIDLASGKVTATVPLPAEPYTVVVSPDGRFAYVSLWGGAKVQRYLTRSLEFADEWETGQHPNAMVFSANGRRLFVACGSSSSVWVFDTLSGQAIEQISVGLYPQQPPTATPNSLSLSPDGRTLLAATADNNAVAVINVANPVRSLVDGFIPTGWYPTGAIFSRDGRQIFVLSGKGLAPAATTDLEKRLLGAVSVLETPERATLASYTRTVYDLTPYKDKIRLAPAGIPVGSPIPQRVGGVSPIKHVFYIIRENRTYDQVLGDLRQGNGDPTLAIFGGDVTPNAHKLALQFTLFDNFYVDADVSYNGHPFSTAAYATDVVEKIWQTVSGNRGGPHLGEGGGFMRTPFGNITAPPGGYIWDYAQRAGVSVRSYGEYVRHLSRTADGDVVAVENVPGLAGLVAPSYAGFDLNIPDQKRVDAWLEEFRQYEQDGRLPQLNIIRLGNDHTQGTTPGAPTPRAMVADNDLALGRIVEAVSQSDVYWKDSAIFALEDDAQSGPDHVDSHRAVLLIASPFARRGYVDHTFYTTSGVLRTIELILGLPPMSHYDAAATPMYRAFQATPVLQTAGVSSLSSVYAAVEPGVDVDEKNPPAAFGALESAAMDFSVEDRIPERRLNEILWRSVKGADSPMPPPRRSAFVRPSGSGDGDEDEDE